MVVKKEGGGKDMVDRRPSVIANAFFVFAHTYLNDLGRQRIVQRDAAGACRLARDRASR
eukprot:COSAG01_NODE_66811_length_269_cov_0.541176_1_plen_58_part_10